MKCPWRILIHVTITCANRDEQINTFWQALIQNSKIPSDEVPIESSIFTIWINYREMEFIHFKLKFACLLNTEIWNKRVTCDTIIYPVKLVS